MTLAQLTRQARENALPCGQARASYCEGKLFYHHRKLRSAGGKDNLPNLVWLCVKHHNGVHDQPLYGYQIGLLLHSWDPDPTEPWSKP